MAPEHDGADGANDSEAETGPPVEKTPGGRAALVRALCVRRNAKLGFGFGLLFTLAVVGVFVIDPGATTQSSYYYVGLAFVLAVTVGMLATAVLVAGTAYRLSKEL